jgi:hypothetical protein
MYGVATTTGAAAIFDSSSFTTGFSATLDSSSIIYWLGLYSIFFDKKILWVENKIK